MFYRCFCIILVVFLLSACAVNPATGQRDFVLMSEQEELALGRQYSKQVMKKYRAYENQKLQQYIQSVGDRVARVSHRNSLLYRFTLLDSAEVNAFALPGGYIYITRGLLAYLNSEAELAAVLGHELGHVTARHSVRQHSMSTTTQLLGSIIAAASGVQGVGQLTNLLGTSFVRGYGREHELEADGLGVEYVVKAGYSAGAMERAITVLKNQELFDKKLAIEQGRKPRAYHGVFSTHPANDIRLQQVLGRVGAAKLKTGQDVQFLKRLDGLTFGDSERDGVIRGDTFYHKELGFSVKFPTKWLINNGENAIDASSPKNEAFIRLTVQDINKRVTSKQFLKARLNGQKMLSEMTLPAGGYSAVVEGKTPYGEGNLRVSVLFHGQRAFIFYSTAKRANQFALFDSLMLRSIKSFAVLTPKNSWLGKALKIHLSKASYRAKSVNKISRQSPITHHAEDQIRLLNGLFPKGEPKTGDRIKIIR